MTVSQDAMSKKLRVQGGERKGMIGMQSTTSNTNLVLERIDSMEKELEFLKRDFIYVLKPSKRKMQSSLYGSIKGKDVSGEAIEKAKQSLFRHLEDI